MKYELYISIGLIAINDTMTTTMEHQHNDVSRLSCLISKQSTSKLENAFFDIVFFMLLALQIQSISALSYSGELLSMLLERTGMSTKSKRLSYSLTLQ